MFGLLQHRDVRMTISMLPEVVVSRLETEIVRSESRSYTHIINIEKRLEDRIENLQRELSRANSSDRDVKWLLAATGAFILGVIIPCGSDRHRTGDSQPVAQVQHSATPTPQMPPPRSDAQ